MTNLSREQIASTLGPMTTIEKINPLDLQLHRHVVRDAILNQSTNWCHVGQGRLRAYLIDDVCIHIRHPDLQEPDVLQNGLYHDHRFTLRSHVILGTIRHTDCSVHPCPDDPVFVKLVEAGKTLKGNYGMIMADHYIRDATYTCPKFRYHRAVSADPITVTIVIKSDVETVSSRLINQFQQGPLINPSKGTVTARQRQHVLDETLEALS